MSASGYKQTFRGQLANVRFTPKSGHSDAQERVGLKKRTLNVCFTPESGRSTGYRRMSAFDPKRTLGSRGGSGLSFLVLVSGQPILEGIKLSRNSLKLLRQRAAL